MENPVTKLSKSPAAITNVSRATTYQLRIDFDLRYARSEVIFPQHFGP